MLVQKVLDLTVQRVRFMKVVIIVGNNVQVMYKSLSRYRFTPPSLYALLAAVAISVSSLPGSERLYKSSRLSC